nr:MAG TPA: hypothetical protein [Caudoviricetes sp.]
MEFSSLPTLTVLAVTVILLVNVSVRSNGS